LAWRLEATASALSRLESLGVPVFYDEPHSLAQIPELIESLGELAGTSATAKPLARTLRADEACEGPTPPGGQRKCPGCDCAPRA